MRFRFLGIALAAVLPAALLASLGLAAPSRLWLGAEPAPPVDVELVLAVDVSYSMDPEEQQFSAKAISRRSPRAIHARDPRRHPRQGRHHLFRMGRAERPEDHRALAADRRPGIGRRVRRRDCTPPFRRARAPRSAAR